MPGAAAVLRHELIGLAGVFERNVYLVRRYIWWDVAFFLWTVANTLTIVFIAKGIEATGGQIDVDRVTTTLLVGAVVWAYLGIIFEILTETVAWERWEGTIEYTFMAPLSRPIHLFGMGAFAIVYGVIRAVLLFGVVALFFDLNLSQANFAAALVVLLVASISFIGIGMMTAVLPLISPEKGTQLGFIAQGLLLVVSGVYYPVEVLPQWMQWISVISPATYALDGMRDAIIDGAGITAMGDELWPLVVIGIVSVPLGLEVFRRGERYAKRHGTSSKRSSDDDRGPHSRDGCGPRGLDSRQARRVAERVGMDGAGVPGAPRARPARARRGARRGDRRRGSCGSLRRAGPRVRHPTRASGRSSARSRYRDAPSADAARCGPRLRQGMGVRRTTRARVHSRNGSASRRSTGRWSR